MRILIFFAICSILTGCFAPQAIVSPEAATKFYSATPAPGWMEAIKAVETPSGETTPLTLKTTPVYRPETGGYAEAWETVYTFTNPKGKVEELTLSYYPSGQNGRLGWWLTYQLDARGCPVVVSNSFEGPPSRIVYNAPWKHCNF